MLLTGQGFLSRILGNGVGSLAIGKIAQFSYKLGKVKMNMNLTN